MRNIWSLMACSMTTTLTLHSVAVKQRNLVNNFNALCQIKSQKYCRKSVLLELSIGLVFRQFVRKKWNVLVVLEKKVSCSTCVTWSCIGKTTFRTCSRCKGVCENCDGQRMKAAMEVVGERKSTSHIPSSRFPIERSHTENLFD